MLFAVERVAGFSLGLPLDLLMYQGLGVEVLHSHWFQVLVVLNIVVVIYSCCFMPLLLLTFVKGIYGFLICFRVLQEKPTNDFATLNKKASALFGVLACWVTFLALAQNWKRVFEGLGLKAT